MYVSFSGALRTQRVVLRDLLPAPGSFQFRFCLKALSPLAFGPFDLPHFEALPTGLASCSFVSRPLGWKLSGLQLLRSDHPGCTCGTLPSPGTLHVMAALVCYQLDF